MAGKKISQLPSGSLANLPLNGILPVVHSGVTYQHNLTHLRQILVDSGSHYFTGSQFINGNLTVQENTNFGNSLNDLHKITGSVLVTGSLNVQGSGLVKEFLFISGFQVIGTPTHQTGSDAEKLHVGSSGSINIAHFQGDNQYYTQINVKNINSSSLASSDIVATADNGNESIHFVDLGINSSTYTGGLVGYENDAYLLNVGKDLYVGTVGGVNHPAKLKLFAENSWENPQITIHTGSQVTFNTPSFSEGYSYEFSGSIKLQDELSVDGSVTASYFIGDGSRLTNLPNGLGGNIADFSFTSETITNDEINIVAQDGDIILDADGHVYIGSSNPGNGIVTYGYLDTIIGDTNIINNGTGHSIVNAINDAVNSIDRTKLINNDLEFVLDINGTLNTPLLIPTAFSASLTEEFYTGNVSNFTLTNEPWTINVSFVVSPDGIVETQIDNIFPIINNPGYVSEDSFEFGYETHGISGYTFTVVLNDVYLPGGAGWTSNISVSQPPSYPSTFKSLGAIKLTANDKNLTLGTDGSINLPNGGTIIESVVTENPTIELKPATPDVQSQKLVIKGGMSGFPNTQNGITIYAANLTYNVSEIVQFQVYSESNAATTMYWWIDGAPNSPIGTPDNGEVSLDESGWGYFSFELDSDDESFVVYVSDTLYNAYGNNNGAVSLEINGAPDVDDLYHLHLTTGDLTETSIILGTDAHNVRTMINGDVQLTSYNYDTQVSSSLTFDRSGNTSLPGDLNVTGSLIIGPVSEKILSHSGYSAGIDFDYSYSTIHYITDLSGNGTWNIFNIPTTEDKAVTITFVIDQGITPYSGSAYQINGDLVNIKWVDSLVPTGSANKTNIIGLTAFRVNSAWNVLGSLSTFGS